MTLPSSGSLDAEQINTELGVAITTTRSLNDTDVRNMSGIASGSISYSDLYGKSAITYIGTFSTYLVRDPASGWAQPYNPPNGYYVLDDFTAGSLLGYSTWEVREVVFEQTGNNLQIKLPLKPTPYEGITVNSINSVQIYGELYPVTNRLSNSGAGGYNFTWIIAMPGVVLPPGSVTINVI